LSIVFYLIKIECIISWRAIAAIRFIPRSSAGVCWPSAGFRWSPQLANKQAQCIAPLLRNFGDIASISARIALTFNFIVLNQISQKLNTETTAP
jgi:hypothetical protein